MKEPALPAGWNRVDNKDGQFTFHVPNTWEEAPKNLLPVPPSAQNSSSGFLYSSNPQLPEKIDAIVIVTKLHDQELSKLENIDMKAAIRGARRGMEKAGGIPSEAKSTKLPIGPAFEIECIGSSGETIRQVLFSTGRRAYSATFHLGKDAEPMVKATLDQIRESIRVTANTKPRI